MGETKMTRMMKTLFRSSRIRLFQRKPQASNPTTPQVALPPSPQVDEREAPGEEKYYIGTHVTVQGLKSRMELNGMRGRLISWDGVAKRWRVKLAKGAGECNLKLDNMQQEDPENIEPE